LVTISIGIGNPSTHDQLVNQWLNGSYVDQQNVETSLHQGTYGLLFIEEKDLLLKIVEKKRNNIKILKRETPCVAVGAQCSLGWYIVACQINSYIRI
jgi:hypothetical protein